MLLHDEVAIRKRTLASLAIVVDIVVQGFPDEVLSNLSFTLAKHAKKDLPRSGAGGGLPHSLEIRLRTWSSPLLDLALIQSAVQLPVAHSKADLPRSQLSYIHDHLNATYSPLQVPPMRRQPPDFLDVGIYSHPLESR